MEKKIPPGRVTDGDGAVHLFMSKKHRKTAAAETEPKHGTSEADKSPAVHQRDKIQFELAIRQRFEPTARQKQFLDLVLGRETRIIFLAGPAGTAKSYLSVLAGLTLLNKRSVSDLLYIRSVIESASKSMGYLPGEAGDKMEPYLRPLRDKLDELLGAGDVDRLIKDKRCEGVPVNFLRGASFNARFLLVDEAQNLDQKELVTVLTRMGKFSKLIVAGDPMQSDINGRSGFMPLFRLFNDDESRARGIHCFEFTKEDIVRSETVAYIVGKIEASQQKQSAPVPV